MRTPSALRWLRQATQPRSRRPGGELRAAFFCSDWPPGESASGIVTYIAQLRPALEPLGIRSRVLAARRQGDDPDLSIVDDKRPSRARRALLWARQGFDHELAGHDDIASRIQRALERLDRRWPVDVFEMEESFGWAGFIARRSHVPVIVRLHGPWLFTGPANANPLGAPFERQVRLEGLAMQTAAGLTSPSQVVLDRMREHYGLPFADAAVIPNPTPVVPEHERWTLQGSEPGLILFVGRFDRIKGGDVMLDAFARVAREDPQARLVFVGPDRGLAGSSGRMLGIRQYLDERIADAEVRGRVDVLGSQTRQQITRLRQRARVAVVASRYETFPMTVLEALASGSPLVTSRVGGIAEMVRDGHNALTFEGDDAASLAAQLMRVLRDPQLAARLGEAGLRDALAGYHPDVVAKQTAEYYRRVRERARRRR